MVTGERRGMKLSWEGDGEGEPTHCSRGALPLLLVQSQLEQGGGPMEKHILVANA